MVISISPASSMEKLEKRQAFLMEKNINVLVISSVLPVKSYLCLKIFLQ